MRTVQPAIMIGSYGWDQDRLPRDEFDLRIGELDRLMDANGWSAMLIHGDCEEHRLLAYYTNFVPRLRWAMALLPRKGEPRLLISMSARDVPAMKLSTWIADVRTGWDWGHFESWLKSLADGSAIGTLGFDGISGTLFGAVERSLGNRFDLRDASGELPRERPLRPRELSLAQDGAALVKLAAATAAGAWRQGRGNEAALLAGERTARANAAQDVRTLVSLDGGRSLVPFQGMLDARHDPFLAHIAVKESGFWAELFLTLAERPSGVMAKAEAGLDAALALMRPDADLRTLSAAALRTIAPLPLHPVLGGRVGRRIGLSLDEGEGIEPGSLWTLHVGAVDPVEGGAIASAMIAVAADGAHLLCRSRDV
ncbi:MAG TPA: aminopeptidase P family N-terminal domain-containing protein [Stellaceae bacterium]|nr:aminopeptidase P family N-terminal domain-containing protein [Stellaceae bacterium]